MILVYDEIKFVETTQNKKGFNMTEHWPTNDEIAAYKFNDSELDVWNTSFNYYARAELIKRRITKKNIFK